MKENVILLKLTYKYNNENFEIYPCVIQNEKNLVLVDCGYPNSLSLIEKEMLDKGLNPQNLTHLFLTHQDDDHMGSAWEIKEKYPHIKIVASSIEKPYLEGEKKNLRLIQGEEVLKTLPEEHKSFGIEFCKKYENLKKVNIDISVENGDILEWGGNCKVLLTSGHTPGHISLYLEKLNIIITGDAGVIENNELVIANPQFCLDLPKAKKSLEMLKNIKAEKYFCYHGGILENNNRK